MTTTKHNNTEEFRKACLRRHYENMTYSTARRLLSELSKNGKETAKSKRFKKRINYAKGYEFLK